MTVTATTTSSDPPSIGVPTSVAISIRSAFAVGPGGWPARGIEAEDADRLFELFYRSARTAKATPGAGIGLFVCARLVRAMDGRIWGVALPEGGAEFGFALRVMTDD